jgi:hypothetical protein
VIETFPPTGPDRTPSAALVFTQHTRMTASASSAPLLLPSRRRPRPGQAWPAPRPARPRRLRRRAGHRPGWRARPVAAGRRHRQSAGRPAPLGRDRLAGPRPAHPPAARLGNPALRQLFAPPGPDLRAPVHALRDQPRRGRHRPGAGLHGALPAGAAGLPGGLHLLLKQGASSTWTACAAR